MKRMAWTGQPCAASTRYISFPEPGCVNVEALSARNAAVSFRSACCSYYRLNFRIAQLTGMRALVCKALEPRWLAVFLWTLCSGCSERQAERLSSTPALDSAYFAVLESELTPAILVH